jgi:outer membrane immunogenic protein
MKRASIAGSAVLALALGTRLAGAADLPVGPVAAPAYLPPPFTWTGFYVGGNIGGAWAKDGWTDSLFGLTWNNSTNNGRFIGGGEAGFNYQIGYFVVGVEGDFDWVAQHNNSTTVVIPAIANSVQVASSDSWISTVAARFAFAADRWLIYGKAGGGWVANNGFTVTNVTTGQSSSTSSNAVSGWLAGAGVEWAITPNWTVKAEYDYLGLGSRSVTLPGTVIPALAGDTFTTGNRNVQLVKFGINYLFSWATPVIARY